MNITRKNMLPLCVLDILKEHSDEQHHLTQGKIIEYLDIEYNFSCERKAIGRTIVSLIEYGYDIENSGGYYLASRELEDSERRLLIDSVYFSPHIPKTQSKALIEKLKSGAGPSFGKGLFHVDNLAAMRTLANPQFFYTLQVLDEAIGTGKKVRFNISTYTAKKELVLRQPEPYTVSPYRLITSNARYYLLCFMEKLGEVVPLRVDRMTNCDITDEPCKPLATNKGYENGIELPKYLAEHIYMRSGESVHAKFRIANNKIFEAIDWFGTGINIQNDKQKEGYSVVSLKVNRFALMHWAFQYMGLVEVLEPADLRGEMKEMLKTELAKYQ